MSKNMNPLVVTIIVHYRAVNECLQLIKDLQSIDYPNHQCLIVDNSTDDDVYNELNEKLAFPYVHLIRNKRNNGYGGGINFGIRHAASLSPSFYHIINTDTRIISKTYISQLVNCFKKSSKVGLIGPGVANALGGIQNTIMDFPSLYNAFFFRMKHSEGSIIESAPKLIPVDVINGVCFMVRAVAFNKTVGFDEDYFMYGEEHDFCYRLQRAGFKVCFWSGKAILHEESHKNKNNSFSWRAAIVRINQVMYLRKRSKFLEATILSMLFAFTIILKKIKGHSFSEASLRETISGLFNPKAFNQRIIEMQNK